MVRSIAFAGLLAGGAPGSANYSGYAVGENFKEALRSGGFGPEMVVVPAGSFRMGCLNDDGDCDEDELPVHEVLIERAFAVSKHEVTFNDYDRFAQATGRRSPRYEGGGRGTGPVAWGRDTGPVVDVSWHNAKAYVAWLSSETGATYRLLSESEWEYAARAGTETKYSWGGEAGSNRANCRNCGSQWDGQGTAAAGSFAPNAFGLHDVHGNVSEWVEDCWNRNYEGAPTDGGAWNSGDCSVRVFRGGGFISNRDRIRSAHRSRQPPDTQNYNLVGFRVARTLTP